MSKEQDRKLYNTLTAAGKMLKGITPVEGEEYTLESILAEFGSGAAKPAPEETAMPADEEKVKRAAPSRLEGKAKKKPVDEKADTRRLPKLSMQEIPLKTAEEGSPGETKKKPFRKHDPVQKTETPHKQEPVQEAEPAAEPAPAEEREDLTPPDRVFIKDVMRDTVDSALAEREDGILPPPVSLKERLQGMLPRGRGQRRVSQDTEQLWDEPAKEPEPPPLEPEPDSDEAARYERRRCKHLYHFLTVSAVPTLVLVVLAVLEALELLPPLWYANTMLRSLTLCGVLAVDMLLMGDVWRSAVEHLKKHQVTCELSALVITVVVLLNGITGVIWDDGGHSPFAASAAVIAWLCQWGMLHQANARREAFHLANVGGDPPYAVGMTGAGACKQKGRLAGFYHQSDRTDAARAWQNYTVPFLLAAATILACVVAIGGDCMERFLWIWSAMLCAAVPMALPLQFTLPMARLQHRLTRGGSALAGYAGAKTVGRARRMIVTEGDLFPPGTVEFNGYKVFGEERLKMLSYAATAAHASHSQLSSLFDQQLASEGGFRSQLEDLQFHEEGGVSGTIRGETVWMGSAYFMKQQHVALPHDLKLQTGVYLAIDGVLGAIFVIKYQPSRNVEWALRALKRAHMPPLMAVRSGNVTPGLLKRKFAVDCKPIYPDVTTRLALSDTVEQYCQTPHAILYREGLMPLVETVIGAKRLMSVLRSSMILSYIGGAVGLFLTYYLTSVASYSTLTPLYMLLYGILWLIPTLLLSGFVKRF